MTIVRNIAGQTLPKTTSRRAIASNSLSQGAQRRLPPLNAVRAFEAAARLGGFNAAGAELNVSANAVGRLVKLLEDWLGVALFRRLPRGVAVTEAGGRYLVGVSTLLDQLAEATADLQRLEIFEVLTVSAAPSLISHWSIPRLCRFTGTIPTSKCASRCRRRSPTSLARKSTSPFGKARDPTRECAVTC